MGKYINVIDEIQLGSSFEEKCSGLIEGGAAEVSGKNFEEDLVCVVDNGWMAAAGYAYDYEEYSEMRGEDGRPKRWFILKGAGMYAD